MPYPWKLKLYIKKSSCKNQMTRVSIIIVKYKICPQRAENLSVTCIFSLLLRRNSLLYYHIFSFLPTIWFEILCLEDRFLWKMMPMRALVFRQNKSGNVCARVHMSNVLLWVVMPCGCRWLWPHHVWEELTKVFSNTARWCNKFQQLHILGKYLKDHMGS